MLGYRIPFDLLAAVTGTGEADLIWALRELVAGRACWSRPARTSSRSGTRWCARRWASACWAGSAGGCTRPPSTRCWPPATPTGPWWPSTPAAPAATTTCWPRPAPAARPTSPWARRSRRCSWPSSGWRSAADDVGLLATAAHAAWLAGLLDDADALRPALAGAVAARAGRRGRGAEPADPPGLGVQDIDRDGRAQQRAAQRAPRRLPPGPEQARAMATLAQSARLRDLDDESLAVGRPRGRAHRRARRAWRTSGWRRWSRRARCWRPRADTLEEGRALLARWPTRPRRLGEWLRRRARARTSWCTCRRRRSLARPGRPAGADALGRRAGRLGAARGGRVLPGPGPAVHAQGQPGRRDRRDRARPRARPAATGAA